MPEASENKGLSCYGQAQVERVLSDGRGENRWARVWIAWDAEGVARGGGVTHYRKRATLVAFGSPADDLTTLKEGDFVEVLSGTPEPGRPYEAKGKPGEWIGTLDVRVKEWRKIGGPAPAAAPRWASNGPSSLMGGDEDELGDPFADEA